MKKQFLFILITLFGFTTFAQTNFEEGYFIISGEKTDCYIENLNWDQNPTTFKYKSSDYKHTLTASIDSVEEFGILHQVKYVRAVVNIDRTNSTTMNNNEENSEFKREKLFLKVLAQGKASLYLYNDYNISIFFFKVNDSEIKQLIHYKYLDYNAEIKENNQYINQLRQTLTCKCISSKSISKIKYTESSLVNIFNKFNKCFDSFIPVISNKQSSISYAISLKSGLSNSSFKMQNGISGYKNADFGNKQTFRFGILTEVQLLKDYNNWTYLLEPSFQYYKSESDLVYVQTLFDTLSTHIKINYYSLEIPIGIRYYMYSNDKSKLFANAYFVYDITFSSSILTEREDIISFDINSAIILGYNTGLGYIYDNKYSIELNYGSRDLLSKYPYWTGKYKTISLVFGYTIFNAEN